MFNQPITKQIAPAEYFSKIEIPEDWESLEDFVDWYFEQRIPLMIPYNAEVIRSDDAVAICVFKKGRYQVELYLQYPKLPILRHAHPHMEVITVTLGGGSLAPVDKQTGTAKVWGTIYKKLMPGEFHGGDTASGLGNGFVTLTFEKWSQPELVTSAAVDWRGNMHGPIQENLIRSKTKDAYIEPGYADVDPKGDDNGNV